MAKKRVLLTRPEYQASASSTASRHQHPPPLHSRGGGGVVLAGETTSTFKTITEDVERMSPVERKKLLDSLALLVQQDTPGRDLDLWAEAVSSALAAALRGAGAAVVGPVLAKRLLGGAPWRPVSDFIQEVGLTERTVQERLSAFRLLAGLLVEHARYVAQKSGAPLSMKLVASCSVNLAGVFEGQFPGYLSSGMAMVPFRQYAKGKLVA